MTTSKKPDQQDDKSAKPTSGVEGEGSYTATHNYNEGLEESVKAGNSEELGEAAKKALEGPEAETLRQAERAAKAGQSKVTKKSN
ncbi:MAG: hypothetical protein ABIP39_07520 [Polyangiaceae bacterium]